MAGSSPTSLPSRRHDARVQHRPDEAGAADHSARRRQRPQHQLPHGRRDNTDDTIGGALQNFSLEAVQEFNIQTMQYKAEYGRSSGGVLSVVTKTAATS